MSWAPATAAERDAMLAVIGVKTMDDLFASVPKHLRAKSWDLPAGLSEMAVRDEMGKLAARNASGLTSFMGGGAYDRGHCVVVVVVVVVVVSVAVWRLERGEWRRRKRRRSDGGVVAHTRLLLLLLLLVGWKMSRE